MPVERLLLLLVLVAASTLTAASQSGRRVVTPVPTAPIQPSLNPEPEPRPAMRPSRLLFLPESLRDRPIRSLDSGTFRLADFEGKVVVINIWASWCGPCRREVPEYEKVRKGYAEGDVEFIGLTTEDPRTSSDKVKKFLRDVKFGFRLGWADRDMARTLMNGRNAIPQTLVIDANGRVVDHWTGYAPGRSGDRLKQTIERALE
ncbi:MAG TPA: TlpA disulfide reductase family protein [Pyrinomonadaceae bacterium]|nr:TlpA disulfide reductase family protein [Pyrinomonadaceae bacterium]